MAHRHEVAVPSKLDLSGVMDFLHALRDAPSADEYAFDFSGMGHISPIGMLLGATELRRFRNARLAARFQAVGFDANGYAAHMGFFRAFGLKAGKAPGEASGSDTYVPVTIVPVGEVILEARELSERFQEALQRRAEQVAAVLAQTTFGPLYETLAYSLREMFRNVLEHSESETLSFAAQHWPSRHTVEVAIVDEGVGIRRTLARNPHLRLESDEHALSVALLPGVSGKAFRGRRMDRYDEWQNSGYGLFMTSRLCATDGRFFVGSGTAGLTLGPEGRNRFEFPYDGVALQLRLRTDRLNTLAASLADLRREGQEIARTIKGTVLTPSAASQMLAVRTRSG